MGAAIRRPRSRGQALVEFSLVLIVFLTIIMGIVDLGRGIYMFNGVSEAARELARATSVHAGAPLGTSAETAAVLGTQKKLVPALGSPAFSCVDIDDSPAPVAAGTCENPYRVKVTITAPYRPVTPLVSLLSWTMSSTSSVQIP
jgi:Flp pilus assembly protein TadG